MEETLQRLKADFRAHMNGVASARMREAGLAYHVNFGIELPRLQEIAKDYEPDHELAQQLWMENVRESKIVAALLMPTERFSPELAELWAEQIPNAEIAQTTTLYLFSRLPFASQLIFPWIASDREMLQLSGLLLATRLLAGGIVFNPSSQDELLDQAQSLAASSSLFVRKAANNLLTSLSHPL